MNCRDARPYLPWLLLPACDNGSAELTAARRHVEECAACRLALRREGEEDEEIFRQMADIPVPEGLADRLARQIAAMPRHAAETRAASVRRMGLLAGAAGIVLALCIPLLVSTFVFQPTIPLADLWSVMEKAQDVARWPASSRREFPMGWTAVPELSTQPFRTSRAWGVPLHAARFQFVPRRGSEPVAGTLWGIDGKYLQQVQEIPPLEQAEVRYGSGHEFLIWQENGAVYIVDLDGGGLHALHARLLRMRTLA
jgi:hypothetical protein